MEPKSNDQQYLPIEITNFKYNKNIHLTVPFLSCVKDFEMNVSSNYNFNIVNDN